MRRMNYNPLNNVYASGEYEHSLQAFFLDKNFEPNHVYYLKIFNGSNSYGPAIIDFRNNEDYNTSIIIIKDQTDVPHIYGVSCEVGNNKIAMYKIDKPLDAGEKYLIYVYQLI